LGDWKGSKSGTGQLLPRGACVLSGQTLPLSLYMEASKPTSQSPDTNELPGPMFWSLHSRVPVKDMRTILTSATSNFLHIAITYSKANTTLYLGG
jgi:hypothetical protein